MCRPQVDFFENQVIKIGIFLVYFDTISLKKCGDQNILWPPHSEKRGGHGPLAPVPTPLLLA